MAITGVMFNKPQKIRSKKIRMSAKNKECTLRIPGVCNHDRSTTVLAHLPGNKGTATKNHDLFAVYACSNCHDWLDGRKENKLALNKHREALRALQETQIILYQQGLIEVK